MSPASHPVRGRALSFVLEDEMRIVREQLGTRPGRVGRTLVKAGTLSAALVGMSAGGALRPHRAEGPITLHVLEGAVELEAEGTSWSLPAGTLFALEGGIVHAVTSATGGIFLLTLAMAATAQADAPSPEPAPLD
jgi:quercetin dioxygenase-like cupin family protein